MKKLSRSSKRSPNCAAKHPTKRGGTISPPRKACAFAPVSWRVGWWITSGATTRARSCRRLLNNPRGSLALPSFCVVGGLTPRETLQTGHRSEEHTPELQSLMRISYAVFCLKKKNPETNDPQQQHQQIKNKQPPLR